VHAIAAGIPFNEGRLEDNLEVYAPVQVAVQSDEIIFECMNE